MRLLIATVLGGLMTVGCSTPSQTASSNKMTIQFTGVVTKIMEFNPNGNHDTFSVEDGEPRFVVFVHIASANPPNYWFQADRDVDFAVRDPVGLFGANPKEAVGKEYQFVMDGFRRFTPSMGRRFTLTSVKREATE